MRLDIRVPLGLLFLVLGSLLLIFGLLSNNDLYERSLGININLWWGIAMSLFALVLLGLAYRGQRRARGDAPSGQG
jgi:hypothetical protein